MVLLDGSSEINGLTPQPEGEKVRRHIRKQPGEGSRRTLAKGSKTDPTMIDSDDPSSKTIEDCSTKIVRATTKFILEPWMCAEDSKKHGEKECGGKDTCMACRLYDALRVTQERCVRVMNEIAQNFWREDQAVLEKHRLSGATTAVPRPWPFPECTNVVVVDGQPALASDAYHLVRLLEPKLNTGIVNSAVRKTRQRWSQERFDVLVRRKKAPTYYKNTFPIPLRASEVKFARVAGDRYVMKFGLTSGRHKGGKEWSVPIVARDEQQRKSLSSIASGEWRIGEVSLIPPNKRKKSRWYVRISYTVKVEPIKNAELIGTINKGITCFIAAATSAGDEFPCDWFDIVAHLKQIQRRRREYQNILAFARTRRVISRKRYTIYLKSLQFLRELLQEIKKRSWIGVKKRGNRAEAMRVLQEIKKRSWIGVNVEVTVRPPSYGLQEIKKRSWIGV